MLVWVAGLSGTGKSSVVTRLRALGYASVDADDGMSGWRDRATGHLVPSPPVGQRPADWIDRYGWAIDARRVEALHARAHDHPVFLAGAVENDQDVLRFCDVVVCLIADADTLRDRLTSRVTNDFGKAPGDIDHVLSWREPFEARHRAIGAVLVDATLPLDAVVDAVIAAAGASTERPDA